MNEINTIILGAGIAGLGAALKAREMNSKAIIFEAKNSAGGLLDNFEIKGFRFDNAVHLSFAKEDKVREIFDQTSFYRHAPDALNFEKDKWLKHPVQNNLYPLPAEDKVKLITSFFERPKQLVSEDYEAWLRYQYGDKITERYSLRYTQKYWDTEAEKLSISWIGDRVRQASADEILLGAFTDDTPNTYYAKEMRYPKKGGYKSFIQPLINDSEIRLNHKVTKIDLNKKVIEVNNDSLYRYETLINTLPLPLFITLCNAVPDTVKNASEKLKATSIDLISVGFNKNIIKDLWFYIYDKDIYASRAYSPSVKSLDNVPNGCSSLQFEIYSRGEKSKYDGEQLKSNVLYALKKMKISSEEDIVFMHHKHLPWGNVIFDSGMEDNREIIRDFLKESEVKSCGRFGEWDYLWSNQALLSGYNVLL